MYLHYNTEKRPGKPHRASERFMGRSSPKMGMKTPPGACPGGCLLCEYYERCHESGKHGNQGEELGDGFEGETETGEAVGAHMSTSCLVHRVEFDGDAVFSFEDFIGE